MQSTTQKIRDLGLTQELLKKGIDLLVKPRTVIKKGKPVNLGPQVVVDQDRIAVRETYNAETQIAGHIRRLLAAPTEALELPANLWDGNFVPHEHQVEAIRTLAQTNVMILTGGPGVGKTTIVKKALEVFRANGLKVVQMAPTGKAAIRMSEQTDFPASTIHRGLGYNGSGWTHNENEPFEAQAIIADETSMVDVHLAAALLAAVRTGARLLLVGDVDQLPSVSAGRVLHDLIANGEIPTVRLTKIFRQASESRIPYIARDINEGRAPADLHAEGTDVRFIERGTEEATLDLIIKAVTKGIPSQKGIQSKDIQVLAAQKTKGVGVEALNYALQNALNATTDHELDVSVGGKYTVRTKDRVIHIENNYDLEVMNGEMGWVLASDPNGVDMDAYPEARTSEDPAGSAIEDEFDFEDVDDADGDYEVVRERERKLKKNYVLVVEFNGGSRQVAYTKKEAKQLLLGYAITVHKSQGSQFPAVVMAVHRSHQWMLTRQLVYTGITRAEKYVLLIGNEDTVAKAARNTRGAERRTQLQRFIREAPNADETSSLGGVAQE